MYRYWTGTAWTSSLTANPALTPPPVANEPNGYQSPYSSSSQTGYQSTSAYQSYGSSPYGTGDATGQPQPAKRSPWGWIIGLGVLVVAIALVVWFVVVPIFNGNGTGGSGANAPQSNPTTSMCPSVTPSANASDNKVSNGRVYGGTMSYSELGDPWDSPQIDDRVPFGPPAYTQAVMDHPNFDGQGSDWVSSVLISALYVGDGFGTVESGAQTVFTCVKGLYYSDATITQDNVTGASYPVDGHDGWLIEADFAFNISNLPVSSEHVILLVVATGQAEEYSLFYASIPADQQDQLLPDARSAMASLQVSG